MSLSKDVIKQCLISKQREVAYFPYHTCRLYVGNM